MKTTQAADAAALAFLGAAAQLARGALAAAREVDPDGLLGLLRLLRAGGMLKVIATMSPTGPAAVDLQVLTPAGEVAGVLGTFAAERETTQ